MTEFVPVRKEVLENLLKRIVEIEKKLSRF